MSSYAFHVSEWNWHYCFYFSDKGAKPRPDLGSSSPHGIEGTSQCNAQLVNIYTLAYKGVIASCSLYHLNTFYIFMALVLNIYFLSSTGNLNFPFKLHQLPQTFLPYQSLPMRGTLTACIRVAAFWGLKCNCALGDGKFSLVCYNIKNL